MYVTYEKVDDLPLQAVQCEFTEQSFELKVHDPNGKHYRMRYDLFGCVRQSLHSSSCFLPVASHTHVIAQTQDYHQVGQSLQDKEGHDPYPHEEERQGEELWHCFMYAGCAVLA